MQKQVDNIEKFQDIRSKLYVSDFIKNDKNDEKFWASFYEKDDVYTTPNLDTLLSLTFNNNTKWTDKDLPTLILEYGKIPPLGIAKLHEMGINGG